jgi:hypothetical protein
MQGAQPLGVMVNLIKKRSQIPSLQQFPEPSKTQ